MSDLEDLQASVARCKARGSDVADIAACLGRILGDLMADAMLSENKSVVFAQMVANQARARWIERMRPDPDVYRGGEALKRRRRR